MVINDSQGASYIVPAEMEQYPELIQLVLNTESMDRNEKQYWFEIFPSMTDKQIDRLYDILETERRKLQELEEKFNDEISKLNKLHLDRFLESNDIDL